MRKCKVKVYTTNIHDETGRFGNITNSIMLMAITTSSNFIKLSTNLPSFRLTLVQNYMTPSQILHSSFKVWVEFGGTPYTAHVAQTPPPRLIFFIFSCFYVMLGLGKRFTQGPAGLGTIVRKTKNKGVGYQCSKS